MVQAMDASRNDCIPNARILVIRPRCATIMICSTRTSAAISVIILSPNCGSCQKYISYASKEKRRYQGHGAQDERHGEQFGNAEESEFRVSRFHQHDGCGEKQQLSAK